MSTHKNAPAAGGNQREGDIDSRLITERCTNMDIIAETAVGREAVAEALGAIDACGCVEFVPGESLYRDPAVVLLVPRAQVQRVVARGVTQLMRAIGEDGRDVPFTQSEWDQHVDGIDPEDIRSWRRGLNGAIRVGRVLAYSYGAYEVAREFELDGMPMIELGAAA